MDLGIKGKRALVVGGSSGLGLACCQALAAEGVNLAVFARNLEALTSTCGELSSKFSVTAEYFSGDITNRDDVRSLTHWLLESGGIDIIILNTPRPPSPMRNFLDEGDDDRWDQAYRDQLHSALNVLRYTTPLLLGKGWGRIIAITSASIKQPMPRHALSSIFRGGVQVALKHLVDEVAPHGVTVNAVAPATIVTPTFSQFHNLEARVADTPLKRAGKPEELGGTVAFLASQQAGYITGQIMQVDGGITRSLV